MKIHILSPQKCAGAIIHRKHTHAVFAVFLAHAHEHRYHRAADNRQKQIDHMYTLPYCKPGYYTMYFIKYQFEIAYIPSKQYNKDIIFKMKGCYQMDIQKIITEALEQLSKNEDLRKAFDVDPVKVLEKILKVDLPDDQVHAVIKAIKAKLEIDDMADVAGKVIGGLGSLFGKK